jgi:hypothetical protein
MTRRTPIPVRFDDEVAARLSAYVRSRPGSSLSSAVNRLVDEGLRMVEHPGIVFRDGPTGRRAGLVGGPDVWELIRAINSALSAEPELDEDQILELVATDSGVTDRQLNIAVRYWAVYAREIDTEIELADQAERSAEESWIRQRALLGRRGA